MRSKRSVISIIRNALLLRILRLKQLISYKTLSQNITDSENVTKTNKQIIWYNLQTLGNQTNHYYQRNAIQ